jgi:ubiquinone biosynthesis protein UbiJ
MKVEQGSAFRSLSSGKVGEGAVRVDESKNKGQRLSDLETAVAKNREAAASIVNVSGEVNREEVVESVKAASNNSVEGLERFAAMLAERIVENPPQAFAAQANQGKEKVKELLQ